MEFLTPNYILEGRKEIISSISNNESEDKQDQNQPEAAIAFKKISDLKLTLVFDLVDLLIDVIDPLYSQQSIIKDTNNIQ